MVLVRISPGYSPAGGRLHTCYSPVRRSPAGEASFAPAAPRLACVKPVASVHPEPGSNSSLLFILFLFFFKKLGKILFFKFCLRKIPLYFRGQRLLHAAPNGRLLYLVEIDRVEKNFRRTYMPRRPLLLYCSSLIVKLSMFACLSGERLCKVRANNPLLQILFPSLTLFNFSKTLLSLPF